MPLPTICTVSGSLIDPTGTPIVSAAVTASLNKPYIDPTSGSLVPNLAVSTMTDTTGAWSLNLIETTTANIGITITFSYVLALNNAPAIYEYTIIVPNTASANFSALVTGQT